MIKGSGFAVEAEFANAPVNADAPLRPALRYLRGLHSRRQRPPRGLRFARKADVVMTSISPGSPYRSTASARVPLRLLLSPRPGQDHLDGGWWPQSRDLALELRELVTQFPPDLGRVQRAGCSATDWDPTPERIPIPHGYVEVDAAPDADPHLFRLHTSNRTTITLLVVPVHYSPDQGDEALLAAATRGNSHAAADLLSTVTEHPDIDPFDHWSDDGGS